MTRMTEQQREAEAKERERQRKFVAWTRVEHHDQTHQGSDPPRATEVWLRRNEGVLLRGPQFERMSGGSPREGLSIDGQHWSDLVDAVAACRANPVGMGRPGTPVPHIDVHAWKYAPQPTEPAGTFVHTYAVDPLRGVLAVLGDLDLPSLSDAARERLAEAHTVMGSFLDNYDRSTS